MRAAQQESKEPTHLKVRVLRAFMGHERKVLPKDWEGDLPRVFALEMKAANKVEFIEAPKPEAAPAPQKDEKSPAAKAVDTRKERPNAA
jgi:hypothetical protein